MIKNGLTLRFTEMGKIKIGGKGEKRKSEKGGEYQLPVRYEHFVVTTTEKGKDGNFVIDKKVMEALGPEPKEIPIRLPFDSIDMNFFTSFQMYHGNKCLCRGDGEHASRFTKDGKETQIKCDPYSCEFIQPDDKGQSKCKPSGILSCIIPASMEAGAVYRFRTHSWYSVSGILASLQYISDNTNGVLQGLPLKLKFLKKATQEHGNVSIVAIVLDGEMLRIREAAMIEYQNRMQLGIDMKRIEDQARVMGWCDEKDDPEDVQGEFYGPVTYEEPKKMADEVTEKLEKKSEPVKANDKDGDLL